MNDRFEKTIAEFDKVNAEDPNIEEFEGQSYPKEVLYGLRMSEWLNKYDVRASEVLKLAARCQHIKRWESPRSDFPEGKAGYYKWRTQLYKFHGDVAAEIMQKNEYAAEEIEKLKKLLLKKEIKTDADAQSLEDVICLVFLDFYFDDFISKHEEDKLITIVQKTWEKMSNKGHELALTIEFSEKEKSIVTKALA